MGKEAGRLRFPGGFPAFQHTWTAHSPNPFLEHELSYNQKEQRQLCEDISQQFNEKQRLFYNEFLSLASMDPKKAQFFVQGPGGTGKLFSTKVSLLIFAPRGKYYVCPPPVLPLSYCLADVLPFHVSRFHLISIAVRPAQFHATQRLQNYYGEPRLSYGTRYLCSIDTAWKQ
jgi:hypothetical protein